MVSNLTVIPTEGSQVFYAVNQILLVSTQRSNVERHRTAADTEDFWGLSAGTLRQGSYGGHSTVTDFAKLRGLSTSVPRAHAV